MVWFWFSGIFCFGFGLFVWGFFGGGIFLSGDGENPSNESGTVVKKSSLTQSISPGPWPQGKRCT